jgi:hypothetical protein
MTVSVDPRKTGVIDPANVAITGGTINRSPVSSFAPTAQTLYTALPNLMAAIRTQNDSSPATLRVIGLGSSVGVGATLPDPSTQAPSAYFFAQLSAIINRLGNLTLAHTNGSVNGSTAASGASGDYGLAKTAAGGAPIVVPMAYGMNDGAPAQYHASQTLPGLYNSLTTLLRLIKGDNADPILFTTPHPHSQRYPWTNAVTSTYPGATPIPALTAGASVVVGDWAGNGTTSIPASYRHKRVNDSIRQFGIDFGVPVIDVERYWFQAVATYGEDALFDPAEYVHPNLLGHQQSYQAAINDFINALYRSTITAGVGGLSDTIFLSRGAAGNATRTTTSLSDDSILTFYAGSNQVWEVEVQVHFTAPTAGDLKVGFSVPSGTSGRMGLIGPANDATTFDTSPGIFRGTTVNGGSLQAGGNGADSFAILKALVRTSTTPGAVTVQFAQAAASGTTTIYSDTSMRARRVA